MIKNKVEKTKKHPRFRVAVEISLTLLGAFLVALCRILFDRAFDPSLGEKAAVARDNFYLFYRISTSLAAVLLILTLLSSLCAAISRDAIRSFHITASVSPILSSALLLAIALFYAYLTHGGETFIAPYVISLGLGEALVMRLPHALGLLIECREKIPNRKEKKNNE